MFPLTFAFQATGSQSWVADRDYDFLGAVVSNSTSTALISTDPTLTFANLSAPSSTRIIYDVLWFQPALNRNNPVFPVRIVAGSTLFVLIATAAGSIIVYLADVAQLE